MYLVYDYKTLPIFFGVVSVLMILYSSRKNVSKYDALFLVLAFAFMLSSFFFIFQLKDHLNQKLCKTIGLTDKPCNIHVVGSSKNDDKLSIIVESYIEVYKNKSMYSIKEDKWVKTPYKNVYSYSIIVADFEAHSLFSFQELSNFNDNFVQGWDKNQQRVSEIVAQIEQEHKADDSNEVVNAN